MFFLADRMIHNQVFFQKAGPFDAVNAVFVADRVNGLFQSVHAAGLFCFKQIHLVEPGFVNTAGPKTDETNRGKIPEFLQELASLLVNQRGGICCIGKRCLMGMAVELPVL